MIAIVKDEEIQRIGYYAVIPATVLFNERLKPNEKLLYALITALSNKEGYCYASNKYLGEKLGVDPVTVSRWITDLRRNNYAFLVLFSPYSSPFFQNPFPISKRQTSLFSRALLYS